MIFSTFHLFLGFGANSIILGAVYLFFDMKYQLFENEKKLLALQQTLDRINIQTTAQNKILPLLAENEDKILAKSELLLAKQSVATENMVHMKSIVIESDFYTLLNTTCHVVGMVTISICVIVGIIYLTGNAQNAINLSASLQKQTLDVGSKDVVKTAEFITQTATDSYTSLSADNLVLRKSIDVLHQSMLGLNGKVDNGILIIGEKMDTLATLVNEKAAGDAAALSYALISNVPLV